MKKQIRTQYTLEQKQAFAFARACGCTIYYDRPYLHVKGMNAKSLLRVFANAFGKENVKVYFASNVVYGFTEPALAVKR
jgi:hypothetical protein